MENVELIIKIPEEVYRAYKMDVTLSFLDADQQSIAKDYLIAGLLKGTQLPKGHGRLLILSEDEVKRVQTPFSFSCQNWISETGLSNATMAIIEADKEDNND